MQVRDNSNSPKTRLFNTVIDHHAADFWLQKLNPLWSTGQALGKIIKKQQIANDMISLTIQTNRHFRAGLAGQHHPVIIECNGSRYERTYSLTVLNPQQVVLSVKKVAQGVVSGWLVDQAQVGDIIEFGQPYGDMSLNNIQPNLVLLAAGSGITPMYSLLESLAQQKDFEHKNVQLLYWVKTSADSAFQAYFEQLSQKHPQFQFQIFYTQAEAGESAMTAAALQQRINPAHLDLVGDVANSSVYACGSSGFVAKVEALFAQSPDLKTEAFSLSPMANDATGTVSVTLSKSQKTVTIAKGQSILEGLEQQNIRPTYGCRMGICNKCVCPKAQGATKNLVNGSENTEPGNLLKLCVNSAQTDLIIDL